MPEAPGSRSQDHNTAQSTARKQSLLKFVLLLVFLGLAGVAFAVIFLLPSQIPRNQKTPATASIRPQNLSTRSSAVNTDTKPQEDDKPIAEKLMSDALRRLARLESEGARIWGAELLKTSLPAAEKALNAANALYDLQQYTDSLNRFREAIAVFAQLEASRPKRFQRAMDRGERAFDALDAQAATAQFTIAVALAPDSQQAKMALDRAQQLPKVLSNIALGGKHENNGDFGQARRNYQAAVALDPAFVPAKEHLLRINKIIADRDYQRAISEALLLLDKQDFKGASSALQRANNIHPNRPEVEDISRRIASTAQDVALDGIRITAKRFEEQEKWADALAFYEKALAIDKNAAFAHRGQVRARSFLKLHTAIDRYLSNPSRLHSPEPLAHAKTLLTQSGAMDELGKTLQAKRKLLQDSISLAESQIPVLLRSDRRTEVVLYRVGNLGSFNARRIKLRPGRYTAAGSRPGFRDVRVQFQVSHTMKNITVTIQCTERIR